MSKDIIYLDPSALKNLGCHRKFYLAVMRGLVPKPYLTKASTHAGTCLHKYAETYVCDGEPFATVAMQKEWYETADPKGKGENRLAYKTGRTSNEYLNPQTLIAYSSIVKDYLDKDTMVVVDDPSGRKKKLVEHKFAIPFMSTSEVDVIVCGTIDKIVRQGQHGMFCLGDYKFTSKWGDPKAFLNAYRIDPQPRVYMWAIRWLAKQFPESIYGEMINSGPLGFFIDGGFHSKSSGLEMVRSPVLIEGEDDHEEVDNQLHDLAQELIDLHTSTKQSDDLPDREGMMKGLCKTIYGECEFAGVCSATSNVTAKMILEQRFEERKWLPLTAWLAAIGLYLPPVWQQMTI